MVGIGQAVSTMVDTVVEVVDKVFVFTVLNEVVDVVVREVLIVVVFVVDVCVRVSDWMLTDVEVKLLVTLVVAAGAVETR